MNYDWLKYEEIEKTEYPNLLAELKEPGYSICTISEWMGQGRCEEGNQDIWDKLTGKTEIYSSESMGLAKLFGVKIGYLFAHELSVINEKPEAYWRWYDDNKRKKEEIERGKAIMEIYDELREKPHLITFMKVCMRLTEQQREKVLLLLEEKAANNKAPCPPGDGATNTEPGGMDAD